MCTSRGGSPAAQRPYPQFRTPPVGSVIAKPLRTGAAAVLGRDSAPRRDREGHG
ncbi:hypothetical protein ACFPM0_00605 [Pseudonocardia sulfidoxydans]|uniref:hypothetical protein n=1 Tax=Pseudonocardia sulfidoxydans TaxID=54011 RepID=UPI003617EE05